MAKNDLIWDAIRKEALEQSEKEPTLASFFHAVVLNHRTLDDALSFHLAGKLADGTVSSLAMRDLIQAALVADQSIGIRYRQDLQAVVERDPACRGHFAVLLYVKGFQALQMYRVAHYYWTQGREALALFLQSRIAQVYAVDIHPAASIGAGIMIDHATSVVIGETAVVEDNVSMLHEVTLGGTGKEVGDRHPKVRSGVLIGAGAKILGNIEIGEGARIGAGSVVLQPVPAHTTVAGVPAVIVNGVRSAQPAIDMVHYVPDWEI
ncbi:MAG: serine O-acetyltransferase [bacterium]